MREIFLPLTSGARLCIPSDSIDDPSVLWPWLDQQGVTIVHSVPSRLQNWLSVVNDEVRLRNFRLLFMAGEPLSLTLVKIWRSRFAGDIVNLYGPTETTLAKSWYRVPSGTALQNGIQPIGGPLPQTQLLLMRSGDRRCGVGELGEIVIRTPFRSLGYLDVEQTRERFRPNPFGSEPGDLLYYTGDLGRYRPDGVLEIAGRLDDQIKIGGVRVEPAEIGIVLSMQPEVAACHVGVVTGADGEKRLVAWVAPLQGHDVEPQVLQKFLASRLPSAMIPARFVMLDSMPLTPNGKVDRRGLPLPVESRPDVVTAYVAPRSEVECELASIWSQVLGLPTVGIHDDFFSLGGHSLLATRVKARIMSSMKVDIPLPRLFEAPTIVELASIVEAARSQGLTRSVTPPMRFDRSVDVPLLSFAQQRLWFLEQLEGEATANNLSYAWEIKGLLDVDILRRALQQIVTRHEPLRTNIVFQYGEPVQIIVLDRRLAVECIDLTTLSPARQDHELSTRRQREIVQPFDLACDLMLRASLLELAGDRHVLLLTMHHIATDGTSLRLLWRELETLYSAFTRGVQAELPELPISYADFARWQRGQMVGGRLELLVDYWRAQLDGVTPLELPSDRPRPPIMSHRGARLEFEIPAELAVRLQALSQHSGATLHMLLLAAFQVLLSRYARQDDIAVGIPVAGRTHTELENLIGCFVNTVIIRTNLSGSPTFNQLLAAVRRSSLAAYEHQEVPFEKLVEELRPERHLDRSPLIQVMFQFLNFVGQKLRLHNLDVSSLPLSTERVALDIELSLLPVEQRLIGVFRYSTDLFDASTITRMADHYQHLLAAIVTDPECVIDELPMLGVAERHQLLVTWNDTSTPISPSLSVHGLFEAQVVKAPHSIAVLFEGRPLSYFELNDRANRLAHHLLDQGVDSQALVGLLVERSLELMVGILGVLKAGAAYVPLDLNHPAERLDDMLQDAGVRYLVTQRRLLSRDPGVGCQRIYLGEGEPWQADTNAVNPCRETGADDRAYVMYTSGSTGRPKGVQVPHRAVVNLLLSMARRPGITSADRLLSVTTPTFDISVLELMLPLSTGASVEIASKDVVADPAALSMLIESSGATIMQATPTTWQMLVNSGWMGSRKLKVLCGGEVLPDQLAADLRERSGELWNMYGPTETTIWSTIKQVLDRSHSGSIGGPIANTQIYVLDSRLQPVPVGVAGELCIAGAGVGLGYLNRAELTAEKFVADPFTADPLARMYRTGDLVRRREDGHLEFQGRLDDQVKLRGFRIEPGEIEAALNAHPAIGQSVVIVREDFPGAKRLVAYLVRGPNHALETSEIRAHLRGSLPEYMLPAAYVVLDSLPLSSSGKVNRLALPAPDDAQRELVTGYVAPGSVLEVALAQIWCEVLGLEQVGVHDDFFALGGHSLLATKLVSRLKYSMAIEVSLRAIFEAPTIAELCDHLENRNLLTLPEDAQSRYLSIVRPLSDRGNVICFGGHVIKALQTLPAHFGVIYLGSGPQEPERFHDAGIDWVVSRYLEELNALDLEGPQVIVGYSYSGLVGYTLCARLRQVTSAPIHAILLEPSLRSSKHHPATVLLLRIGRYAGKVFQHGPGVIANSIRRRREERLQVREATPVDAEQEKQNRVWSAVHRSIALHSPPETDSEGVHLVAGSVWLDQRLDRFRSQLVKTPELHSLDGVTHDRLVRDPESISIWVQLIFRILADR